MNSSSSHVQFSMVDATVFIFLAEKASFFKLIFCNAYHQNVISFTGLKSVFLNMNRNEFSGISIIYTTKTCFKLFNLIWLRAAHVFAEVGYSHGDFNERTCTIRFNYQEW